MMRSTFQTLKSKTMIYIDALNKSEIFVLLKRWKVGNLLLLLLLLITVFAVFVPFLPLMPISGLDPSWVFGLNQAMKQGLQFGKEILFTFGPYAFVYTKAYHPFTDSMMLYASLYLGVSYWLCALILIKGGRFYWVLAFCVMLVGFLQSRDSLLFSFSLLAGLAGIKVIFLERQKLLKSTLIPLYVALIFAPFGLLVLIKGTLTISCVATSSLCAFLFTIKKKNKLALICLLTPLISVLIFWKLAGQSILNLPSYFMGIATISSGYAEAMALNGNILEIIAFLAVSAILFYSILRQKSLRIDDKTFLFLLMAIFLFLSFKSGFVRHDGHATSAADGLIFVGLLLPFILEEKALLRVVFLVLAASFYINSSYRDISVSAIRSNFQFTYSSAWYGLKNRITNGNLFEQEFNKAVRSIQHEASFPLLKGSTDIYSYNQAFLISSGNMWSPRPVFQSLAAYTPELSEANRKHLLGPNAPENIIFSVEPIDGRLPSMEDGISWPAIIENYRPVQMLNNFLFLEKNQNTSEVSIPVKLKSEKSNFGDRVEIPQTSDLIFLQIVVKPTFLGRIANFFLKNKQLQITTELEDGYKRQYRMIPGMAESGFLFSPLIENTYEFGMLYERNGYLNSKRVKSFVVEPLEGSTIFWNNEYNITFNEIRKSTISVDILKLFKLNKFSNEIVVPKVFEVEKCFGTVDTINYMSPPPIEISTSGMLLMSGWLATSVENATLPEEIYIVMTSDRGKSLYLKPQRISRPDVGYFFKNPKLDRSGYSAAIDISELSGQYTLGLAVKNSNKFKACQDFKFQLTVFK